MPRFCLVKFRVIGKKYFECYSMHMSVASRVQQLILQILRCLISLSPNFHNVANSFKCNGNSGYLFLVSELGQSCDCFGLVKVQ